MEVGSLSFIPQLACKEVDLALQLEQAGTKAASIKEEARKRAEDQAKQSPPAMEEVSTEKLEVLASEPDQGDNPFLPPVQAEGTRLAKRAERRTKELTHFVYSKVFLKDR